MPEDTFASLYEDALQLQKTGRSSEFPALIQRGKTAGLTEDDLSILGALFEGAYQFFQQNGPS